jgi:hypothetical protein
VKTEIIPELTEIAATRLELLESSGTFGTAIALASKIYYHLSFGPEKVEFYQNYTRYALYL